MRNICVALLLTATFIAASRSYALEIEGSLPIDGGIHLQKDGKAGISFFYRHRQKIDQRVKIEISTSRRFDKIYKEFFPKGKSYYWQCDLVGKVYWRPVLLSKDGRRITGGRVKSFVVSPGPVTTIEVDHAGSLQIPASGIDFSWKAGEHTRALFYRFKLARDRSFDHPLINVDIKGRTYHLNALEPGQYFWKVGVKYSRDIPIVYSAIRELSVEARALPKPMTVEAETEDDTSTDETPAAEIEVPDAPEVKKPMAPEAKAPVVGEAKKTPSSETVKKPPVAKETPPPAPADLLQPLDQAQLETLEANKSVILQWIGGGDARKFVVEMAQNGDFTHSSFFNSEEMRLGVTLPIGSWFWRVTAVGEGGKKSAPSISRNFSIAAKKIKIELISPEDNRQYQYGKRAASVVFSWRVADGGEESFTYRLQIARDNQWHDISAQREIRSESLTMDDLSDGSYFWRIGVQTTKYSPIFYSDARQFSVQKKRGLSTAPKLSAPDDGAKMSSAGVDLPVFLRWDTPDGSRAFVIELANDPSFRQPELVSSLVPASELTRKPGNYFWRVKAVDGAGDEGPFSEARSFSVIKARESIRLIEPAAEAAIHSFGVDFSWQPLSGCLSYAVIVSLNNTMDNPIKELTTKETKLRSELDDEDVYFWQVICSTKDGRTVKSMAQSFRIVING